VEDVISQMLSRLVMQVALHVVMATQPGTGTPKEATTSADAASAAQWQLWRPLALDCLATVELVWEANWVRPSISSLLLPHSSSESNDSRSNNNNNNNNNSSSSSSPSASIIDLLFAPPYVSVADACSENIAGRLAALLLRYVKKQHKDLGAQLQQELRAGAATLDVLWG